MAKQKKTKKRKKPTKRLKGRPAFRRERKIKRVKRVSVKRRKILIKKKIKKVAKKKPAKARRRAKILVKKKVRKVVMPERNEFSAQSLFKAKIKVIGVGGGGGSIVSEIGRSLKKATFVIADTDIRALKKRPGIKYFWFGQDLTRGLGTGVNVDLAKQAAEASKEKISEYFKDQDIVIFVASLGGGLGSGATQVFAEAAKEFGGITFGIFTMPFKFEGKNKQRIALNALKSLRGLLNVSLVIPNEKIFKIIDESTPITNAFSTVNKSLIESLESLIDLIYNPGIINIDFADLRTILRGRGNFAFLNTVEESGKNRTEKTCENIFKNPLLQTGGFEVEKILFNIAGAETLSMFEVEKISSHIAEANKKAKIIFGISKDSKLKNKIKTTILMTGAPHGAKLEEEKEELEKQPEKQEPPAPAKKENKLKAKKKQIKPKKQQKEKQGVSFVPVFEAPSPSVPILEQKMDINRQNKTIRRSGLEIKKAEEQEEKKRIAQEKEWEIPAFLRKIKFKE